MNPYLVIRDLNGMRLFNCEGIRSVWADPDELSISIIWVEPGEIALDFSTEEEMKRAFEEICRRVSTPQTQTV